jgi:hypothetical protein
MAFCPDTSKAPYFNYPFSVSGSDTLINENIWMDWQKGFGGINAEIQNNLTGLQSLQFLAIDCGAKDRFKWIVEGTKLFDQLLSQNKIHHYMVWHKGGHHNRLKRQLKIHLFPMISRSLKFENK